MVKIPPRRSAFTFVEAIFTIAIIGIMASLAISAISNGARDTYRIVARQQQAAVQEALQAWVMSQSRVTSSTGAETSQVQSIEAIRKNYNSLQTTGARFAKLLPDDKNSDVNKRAGFLDPTTAAHFDAFKAGSDKVVSAALSGNKQYLTLPDWAEGEEPRVVLNDE